MLLPLLLMMIAGEDVPPAKSEMNVKVEAGVKVTDEQIKEVTALAKEACVGEIDLVQVRQFPHPRASLEFCVSFKDEIAGSYVIKRSFVHAIAPTDRFGENLKKQTEFPLKVHLKDEVYSSVSRLFNLKQTEVRCDLGDGVSYDLAKRVLLAIEAKNYDILPSIRSNVFEEIDDLSKVLHVDCDSETKRIEVEISTSDHACSVYGFAVDGESCKLVAADHWY